MYVQRLDHDTLLLDSNNEYEHFIPALFAGSALRAAGKGLKFLAGKAVNAYSGGSQPAETFPGEAEEYGEEFDIYARDSNGGQVAIRSPFLSDLDDSVFDQFAARVADAMMDELQLGHDAYVGRDYDIEARDATDPRFEHFKGMKKLKKLAKKGLAMAGNLAPIRNGPRLWHGSCCRSVGRQQAQFEARPQGSGGFAAPRRDCESDGLGRRLRVRRRRCRVGPAAQPR